MISTPLFASALLLLAGHARAHAASALAVAVAQEQFKNSLLVPSSVLPDFQPIGTLILALPSNNGSGATVVKTGSNLTLEQSAVQPIVSIKGTAAAEADVGGAFNVTTHKYTVFIIDAGPPGANDVANTSTGTFSGGNVVRHYLQNDLIWGLDADHAIQLNATTEPITAYAGPNPPSGSGPHRYVALAYLQADNFTAPDGFTSTLPVGVFNFQSYLASTSGSLSLLSASYFTVEVGATNTSLPQTLAVDSTTLPQYTPPSSATSTGDGHAGHSASATASASATGAASGNTGAGERRVGGGGVGLVVGAGVVLLSAAVLGGW